jgi:ubiquinone/menaquinone biosynthesis C-methylase UbiE
MERISEREVMDQSENAKAYADADFDEVNQKFIEKLFSLSNPCDVSVALDIGTGPGDIPKRLLETRPDWNILATDMSRPMLAQSTKSKNLLFFQSDAKNLPIPDGFITFLFSNSLLHHLPDPTPFWNECKRVLHARGTLLVRDLYRPEDQRQAAELVETYAAHEHPILKEDFFNSLLAAFTPDEIETQLEQCGLSEASVEIVSDRHMDIIIHP